MFDIKTKIQNTNQRFATASNTRKALLVASFVFVLSAAIFVANNLFKDKEQGATATQEVADFSGTMPGWWFQDYFGFSVCDTDVCKPESDPDNDKLTNAQEYFYKSNPMNPDTNGNGKDDGQDVAMGVDPSKEGNVTFEELASDENVLGESILFGDTIKDVINEIVDPNKIPLDLVQDKELNVSADNSKEAVVKYFQENKKIVDANLPSNIASMVETALQNQNKEQIDDLKLKFAKSLFELKKLEVPQDAVMFHKYTILMFGLLPVVIDPPAQNEIADELNPAGNLWYQQTQAYALLMQKMEAEVARIQGLYN